MIVVVDVSFPKGRNESCLSQVGLLHDRWQHHLSPPPQFRQETVGEGNILQRLHPWFLLLPPTRLLEPFGGVGHRTQAFRSGIITRLPPSNH
ncbi:hypothetical protein TNCV_537211 [Trichonephila clavipes]|nr:hypothetical protein TNCV_537211 [Trichonephila clavipes]